MSERFLSPDEIYLRVRYPAGRVLCERCTFAVSSSRRRRLPAAVGCLCTAAPPRHLPALRAAPSGAATVARRAPRAGARTLVIANAYSFTTKDTDPDRGGVDFDADPFFHAVYDTLLTFKPGDTTSPQPLVAESYSASADAQDLHLQAAPGRQVLRRHAAQSRRRRVFLQPPAQPARHPGLSARRRHRRRGTRRLHVRHHQQGPQPGHSVHRHQSGAGRDQLDRDQGAWRQRPARRRQDRHRRGLLSDGFGRQRPVHHVFGVDHRDGPQAQSRTTGDRTSRPTRTWSIAASRPRRSSSRSRKPPTRSC